ncbi:helix-turn-helix transcriptional regulator [Halorientalis regularis]|jgi:PadR family transcriptional regulator PadR|uniref:Transcriptional regulator PadR-like family protein n=1 Tax=Halorientalis regularis TaxID=660518 RepID=A0A1G7FLI5_9EURY|nr:helix-turn-helix transcriptional regulator [Halorientalis regularis]SDE76740.1 Transcriptional regulator PadR-like family protein [Halorientalis regularis]
MDELTGFQRDLLYVVAGLDDPHGLAVTDEFDEYYERDIQHGRLYPNLDTLLEKALIEKRATDRRTNAYSLTGRAKREIEARREWENGYLEDDRLIP